MLSAVDKPKLAAAFLAALLLAVAVSACGISVAEDGPHEVRARKVAAFDRIEVRGSTEVIVEHGSPRALRLEGGANRLHDLQTYVEGDTLVVEQEDTSGTIDIGGDPARVVARVPRVDAVRIDGSGRVVLRDLRGARLGASIYGSGEVQAAGQVERLRSRIDGSGSLRGGALDADEAAVAISGSGSAELGAADRLHAEIDGSGDVSYAGEPAVSEEVSGSGSVEHR
jgi:Putative auto-transporter adhesin, head GIN domain